MMRAVSLTHEPRGATHAGLLYEDVMIETAEVKLALSRLPKDMLDAREQRLKRAMVLSSQAKRVRSLSLSLSLSPIPSPTFRDPARAEASFPGRLHPLRRTPRVGPVAFDARRHALPAPVGRSSQAM